MRKFCVVVLLVVGTFALPVCRMAKGAEDIFSLTISTPSETVKTGSNLELLVKLTNNTNHEITLSSRNTYCDYTFEVRDSNGHSAPETKQKHRLNFILNNRSRPSSALAIERESSLCFGAHS